ncbi:MAG TPA: hypothetical protein VM490_21205 [Armatimonadaceae bacterium]|nr:hypothetical protein [Armatimonadaceae bacterium]
MSIRIELEPDAEEKLREAAAAEGVDAATFARNAVVERLRQNSFARPLTESDLLKRINRGFPESFWDRYRDLAALRDAETLTPEQQRELIAMSDQMEERAAERLQYLVQLSHLRGTSVDDLMRQLGLRPVPVV